MKRFFKENIMIFIYLLLVCLIELFGVLVTSGKFYISRPWVFLLVQLLLCAILLCLPTNKSRHIVSSIFLITFMVVNLVFIVLFEMTETIFDYGMFNLRNDAMAILESIPINFLFFSVSLLLISIYIVFGARYVRHNNQKIQFKYLKLISSLSMVLVVMLNALTLYFDNKNVKSDIYEKLYKSNEASYSKLGITGNFVNELFKGTFMSGVKLGDETALENYIYKDVYNSKFEDIKQDYNLVTMLVESFEWTAFVEDFNLFVNGHKLINPQTNNPYSETEANTLLEKLFPNIYDYYKSSIALTNFYSREKTDIAENLSLLGSYPTDAYINYDFPNNTISSSMANVLKGLTDSNIACNAFHNGSYTYYNRNKELLSVGFDNYYASEAMYELGMTNWMDKGERNLDSEMISACADKMFPTNQRFYTHITTITMHGQYTYRQNLEEQGYYAEMAKYGIVESFDANYNNFYYYTACVKEFDKALGETMNQLKTRGLADNTIILLYGDHNTYYSSLSNYVKDIDNTRHSNYTNLYRVPCMIYHPQLETIISKLQNDFSEFLGTRFVINTYTNSKNEIVQNIQVKKFTCTADIVPTLFDLMGINFYQNLYFGNSVFNETSSVMYSRAYNVFVTDSIYFSNINNIKWFRSEENVNNDPANKYADLSNYSKTSHLSQTEKEAKNVLEKLDVCNRIFYNDYFARTNISNSQKTNAQIFNERMDLIN